MPNLTTLDDAMRRSGRMVPAVNRLGGGMIAMSGPNQPLRVTGDDAVVYQLKQQSGRLMALRCFLADHPEPGLAERYKGLSSHPAIKRLREMPGSPIAREITYLGDGLLLPATDLRSAHHPIITMEWIAGPTLLAAVERACRAGESDRLEALAAAWLEAVDALDEAGFIHGNLSGDNVLVRPDGRLALVDYDTAFWPGAARPAAIDAAAGYRHPAGLPGPDRRDRYPALVIFTSLRVLAHWPELREDNGDPSGKHDGVLLFSPRDLAEPDSSKLFATLRSLADPATRALVGVLREASRIRPGEAPPLREAVAAAFNIARETRPRQEPPRPPAEPQLDSRRRQDLLTRLNGLMLSGDVEAALDFWRTSGLARDPEAAGELGPRIAEIERRRTRAEGWPVPATERAARSQLPRRAPEPQDDIPLADLIPHARPPAAPPRRHSAGTVERLRRALVGGDAATVGALWPELRGDPAAAQYALQATEILAKLMGAAIAGAIERGDDAATIAAIREADEAELAVGKSARRAGHTSRRRIETRRRLREAIAADDRPTLAELAISGSLAELGAIDQVQRRLIMRAVQWPHLERALATDDDHAIMGAYDGEAFALPDSLSPEHRERIALAHKRLSWLDAVRAALRRRDVAVLRASFSDIPADAERRLSSTERARVHRLIARDQAGRRLEAALREGPDSAILESLSALEAAGATLPDTIDWPAMRGVVDRMSLAAAIHRAFTSEPRDYARLSRLLPAARAAAAGEMLALGEDLSLARLEEEVRREAHRGRLREAIARGDDKAIVAAAVPDLYGTVETLAEDERARVEHALHAVRDRNRDRAAPPHVASRTPST